MSSSRFLVLSLFALLLTVASAAEKKQLPPPAAPKYVSPTLTNAFVQKQFGESCSVLSGPPQFVGDLDGDGIDDLVLVAKCKNPMSDRDEYGYVVADPYDAFMGFSDVKVTSTFASDVPERRGLSLLIVHGAEQDGWRAEKPKAKFLLINLPFKTVSVKRYTVKKRTVLGIYMEEQGEGDNTASVVYWDGKKYRYVQLGGTME